MVHLCTVTFPGASRSRFHFTPVVIVQVMDYILDVVMLKNMQAAARQTGHHPH